MADDYGRLAAAYSADTLAEACGRCLSRIPVSCAANGLLFVSKIWERTWAPMYFFFFCHAAGLALIAKWLVHKAHGRPVESTTRSLLLLLAVAVASIYPSAYEPLYWPSCMAFMLGTPLLGLGLWTEHRIARSGLIALSFLSYETFVLPALVLLLIPLLTTKRSSLSREALRLLGVWGSSLGLALAVRWLASLQVEHFHHLTVFSPDRIADKVSLAYRELFHVRFFGPVENEAATTFQYGLVILLLILVWKQSRWRWAVLLLACFASTEVYWVIEYGAPRAIYGSQVLFMAILIALLVHAARGRLRTIIAFGGLTLLLIGYLQHSSFIYEIKSHNARVLQSREAEFAAAIRECGSACVIKFRPLDEGLKTDWVLHPDFWARYLDYMRAKYGAGKEITFELRRD